MQPAIPGRCAASNPESINTIDHREYGFRVWSFGPSRNDEQKKPAVICDDRPGFGVQQVLRPYATQRLPDLMQQEGGQKPEEVT
jgi:hypothetical protein